MGKRTSALAGATRAHVVLFDTFGAEDQIVVFILLTDVNSLGLKSFFFWSIYL